MKEISQDVRLILRQTCFTKPNVPMSILYATEHLIQSNIAMAVEFRFAVYLWEKILT